ncbi:MAG TPA: zinc ribbon domain-containing protein [Anaerolineales bacterium]|nr:zinc ribbon domain-containing protein [Anaerolineales bacterium]
MRKLTFLLLLFPLFLPIPARAQWQGNIRFETVQIDLWPEYDRQAILVILRAKIAGDTQLPVDLTIRIPAEAGEPNAVAVRPAGGPPLNTEYERQVLGEWAYINLTATVPDIQIEYYDPGIVREGALREFVYEWPGDYAAGTVVMLVQQPTGAENLSTIPRLTAVTQDSFGLVYMGGEIGEVAAGESFTLSVSYEKQTDDLTVNFLPIESSEPLAEDTPGRMSLTSALPWAMGIVGIAVIFVGVYWYWSTGRRLNPENRRRTDRRARPRFIEPELRETVEEESNTFCHQCGKRAHLGDRFCRSCGTKLKV